MLNLKLKLGEVRQSLEAQRDAGVPFAVVDAVETSSKGALPLVGRSGRTCCTRLGLHQDGGPRDIALYFAFAQFSLIGYFGSIPVKCRVHCMPARRLFVAPWPPYLPFWQYQRQTPCAPKVSVGCEALQTLI